jgi:hypothetical protein
MKQIELKQIQINKEETALAAHLCQRCGREMRLIGSEPHPVEAETDLLTYCCPPFLVGSTPPPARRERGIFRARHSNFKSAGDFSKASHLPPLRCAYVAF